MAYEELIVLLVATKKQKKIRKKYMYMHCNKIFTQSVRAHTRICTHATRVRLNVDEDIGSVMNYT